MKILMQGETNVCVCVSACLMQTDRKKNVGKKIVDMFFRHFCEKNCLSTFFLSTKWLSTIFLRQTGRQTEKKKVCVVQCGTGGLNEEIASTRTQPAALKLGGREERKERGRKKEEVSKKKKKKQEKEKGSR